jgi:DNA N-6-adenine-methyltransferase (Dam)
MFALSATQPQQKSNEWYTPSKYVEAARAVMGSIDLDPASCELANRTVKATRFYSAKENGLAQEWSGNVWLNPPYGRTNDQSNMGTFTRRLVTEYRERRIKQAILLTSSKTSNSWFYLLWEYPICFTDHNIYFDGAVRNPNTYNGKYGHIHGTCLTYLGPHEQKFIDIFSQFGTIAKRVSTPRPTVQPLHLWEVQ